MREEISFDIYPVPTIWATAKGHKTPNPNKQAASTPQNHPKPLKNPETAFPSVISCAHHQPPPQQMGVGRVIAPLDDLHDDVFRTKY